MARKHAALVVALLLLLQLALLLHTAWANTETFDEPMYLLAGRSYWSTGDFSFNREHPPLSKLLIGAPLALAGLELPADYQTDAATQLRFVYELNDAPQRTLLLGRLPMILLGLLLAWHVYLMARLYAGELAGVVALAAFMLQPALTGNTPLAAMDLGATAFPFMALYQLARLRRAQRISRTQGTGPAPGINLSPSTGRTLAAGVTLGLALLTRYTSLLLLPIYVALAIRDLIRERTLAPLTRLLAVGSVALGTLFLGYAGELRSLSSVADHPRFVEQREGPEVLQDPTLASLASWFGERPIPLLSYWEGLDATRTGAAARGHRGYFRGESERGLGWKSFYVTALAVKTPVGLLLALAMALFLFPWLSRGERLEGPMLLFPLAIFAIFSLSASQLGMRYVLPVCVLAAVLVGRLAAWDPSRNPRALGRAALLALVFLPCLLFFAFPERGPAQLVTWCALLLPAAAGLVLWTLARRDTPAPTLRRATGLTLAALLTGAALEVGAQHPEHLMFFNAFAGGPQQGWRIMSVSDDWGQGTGALARRQQEQGWPRLNYEPYGTAAPEVHGLNYRSWDGAPVLTPESTLVAVHAARFTRKPERYQLLEGLTPIEVVNGILVFDVPAERCVVPP